MYAETSPSNRDAKVKKGAVTEVITLYLGFFALCSLVWQSFQGIGLSTLPTLSVGLQVLAMIFLRVKVGRTKNVRGISAKSLMMQMAVHILRLTSTTWLKGYIPADETGDWFYQLMDLCMLVMCSVLLYTVLKTHRSTYQENCDDFDVRPALLACVLLAVFVHPDLDDRVLFDSLWASALYVDVVAMLPQLWMMSKVGSEVEGLTGHYVAAITASRLCYFVFWYFGFSELAPIDGGFNIAGWTIVIMQVMQLLLLADFMYYYIKAWLLVRCDGCLSANATISVSSDSTGRHAEELATDNI